MLDTLARVALAAAMLAVLTLTGCSYAAGTGADPQAPPDTGASQPADDGAATGDAALMVADSSLGEIVVDGEGMTVYIFDGDTPGSGSSACEGQCAANWLAVTSDEETPVVDGVTAEVGTITGVEGATQVTLNGWPLYT